MDLPLGWLATVLGSDVVASERLLGGWTSSMHAVTTAGGGQAVVRLMHREPWRTHGAGLVTRESEVQRLLEGTAVPAPRSLGLDPTGEHAGHPAHVMSRLEGRPELERRDEEVLGRLADVLATIHRVEPGERPRTYQSWAPTSKRVVPAWARESAAWEAAFTALDEPPAYVGCFLHRDFHPGNVLWRGGEVSGVVDWVETSWGPAALDVAHCRTYLAMLHGPEAATDFSRAYAETGPPLQDQRWWDLLDVVGHLPDPVKVVQPWRDQGHDVSDDVARERLESHLVSLL